MGFPFVARNLRTTFLTSLARLRVPQEVRRRLVNHSDGRLIDPLAPTLLPFAELVDTKSFPPRAESFGGGEPRCRDFPPQC
jgi:hypothetical protein